MADPWAYEREQIESLLRLEAPATSVQRDIGVHLMPDTVAARLLYDVAVAPALWENGINVIGTVRAFDSGSEMRDVVRWLSIAEIIVADVSTGAVDLMYTIGFCHAIGRCPLLLVPRSAELPFDLRRLRHMEYEVTPVGLGSLRQRLTRAVRVFIGASRAAPGPGQTEQG